MKDTPFDMAGETVLITGGGTGLGKQFASVLAAAGARVILCARRVDKLEETVSHIREHGGDAHAIPMDVTDGDSVAAGFKQCLDISPVTVLVNNAGLAGESMLLSMPEEEWDSVVNTNLKGAWLVARAAAQQMIDHDRSGSIINIASVLGSSVQKGTAAYAAAKSGVVHLTRAMALEWARYGIRANAIAPGYYRTDMAEGYLDSPIGAQLLKRIPQRRLGAPAEMDGAILMLASKASTYMTGSVVTVDGGLGLSIV
jgi:NAD(P)-dependent dehydrogenase (short-subunit alcohol dehydrogenase family)